MFDEIAYTIGYHLDHSRPDSGKPVWELGISEALRHYVEMYWCHSAAMSKGGTDNFPKLTLTLIDH